jgi:hypothetical protein
MRNKLLIAFFSLIVCQVQAQSGNEVFSFLRLPLSARANALGGHTVSLVERDPSLAFVNPALLGGEMDGMLNFGYMNYISDVNMGSAIYTKALHERSAWGVGASFISYGNFKEALPSSEIIGTFSAKDISLNGFFSYDLSDKWRGGVSLKMLYSSFANYSSYGVGVDVGLSYYSEDKTFSYGVTINNVGTQIKAYQDTRQKMPWDIQMGISKKMEHAPFRFSVTAWNLNRWKLNYVDETSTSDSGDSFGKTLAKHLIFGIDFIPSDNFWLGMGFNPKVNSDMKLSGGNSFSGFSGGAGISIKSFDVGFSIAKYHPSAVSMMLSVSTTLSDLLH